MNLILEYILLTSPPPQQQNNDDMKSIKWEFSRNYLGIVCQNPLSCQQSRPLQGLK